MQTQPAFLPAIYARSGADGATVLYADEAMRLYVETHFRTLPEGEVVRVNLGWNTHERRVTWVASAAAQVEQVAA